jgi:uncharacterized protein
MYHTPFVISLPIADRPRSYAFYRDAFGLEPRGELADDGVPEPLQFEVSPGVRLMLVPTGGFGWVLGTRAPAPADTSECILSIAAETDAEVDTIVGRAVAAGATVVTTVGSQPWGYAGTVADPDGHLWMVTSAAMFG